jgi:hypothetical protein
MPLFRLPLSVSLPTPFNCLSSFSFNLSLFRFSFIRISQFSLYLHLCQFTLFIRLSSRLHPSVFSLPSSASLPLSNHPSPFLCVNFLSLHPSSRYSSSICLPSPLICLSSPIPSPRQSSFSSLLFSSLLFSSLLFSFSSVSWWAARVHISWTLEKFFIQRAVK